MRGSIGEVRRYVFQAALAALLTLVPTAALPAIFDDGNDRYFIKDLRAKDPASLTAEEKAILAAANKVGVISLCGGKNAGNALLNLYRSRPAVVTAAHFAFNPSNGTPYCSTNAEFAQDLAYMPNTSHYDSADPDRNRELIFRQVGLEFPPENWNRVKGKRFGPENDFLVFYLQEDITRDQMPDGSIRGYLKFSETTPAKGNLYMLGLSGDKGERNMETLYQSHCDGFLMSNTFFHGCDAVNGSSASLIGILEGGDLAFRAAHNSGSQLTLSPTYAVRPLSANVGTSSDRVRQLAKEVPRRRDFLASDLQGILSVSGCYSGKLDNQWGPASRRALAAFAAAAATELPGAEPSPELLAAVEKAAPEGTEVCR